MKSIKIFIAALFAVLIVAPSCGHREKPRKVELPEGYAYVITKDVWGEILPAYLESNPYAVTTHKFRTGEWFFCSALHPETANIYYYKAYYSVPRETFRLLTVGEVQNLMQTDKEFVAEAKKWFLLAEDGEPLLGKDAKKTALVGERVISIANMFWMIIPALLIAALGYMAKVMREDSETYAGVEGNFEVWAPYILLLLYVLELALLLLLIYLGALNDELGIFAGFMFAIPAFILMLINGWAAFTTSSLVLSFYKVEFGWKRIVKFILISIGVGCVVSVLLIPVSKLNPDSSIQSWASLVSILVVFLALIGVDMRKQNPDSLRMLPILVVLITIGLLISFVAVAMVAIAVGIYYIWNFQISSEIAKDEHNNALSCDTCNYRGNCSSRAVPCTRHQDYRA